MSLVLIDTNILLRGVDPTHPMHADAIMAEKSLRMRDDQPCLVAQNLIEFRAVITRPIDVNGMGMSQLEAAAEIVRLKALYPVFLDDPAILSIWEQLVSSYGSFGKQNHDARIVAAMQVHEIPLLLTFNKSDFARYPSIKVFTPQEVLAHAIGPE